MRVPGGLNSIVHTTYCTVAVMRLGQAGFMRGSDGAVSSGNFMASVPNWGLNLRPTHQSGI